MLCHVLGGGAGVDEFVQCGGQNADGVAAVACGLQKESCGGLTIDGSDHLCFCVKECELETVLLILVMQRNFG